MLNIVLNRTVLEDEDYTKYKEDFETGLLMRICHPELSKSGVCPICAAHWYRIFDAKTMQGVDGKGEVPEVGWHTFCVCEDIPLAEAKNLGLKEKGLFAYFKEAYGTVKLADGKDVINIIGGVKGELLDDNLIGVKDVMKYNETTKKIEYAKGSQIAVKLGKMDKDGLLKLAVKMGADKKEIKDLTKKQIIKSMLKYKTPKKVDNLMPAAKYAKQLNRIKKVIKPI